jgi:hypothetical protein
VRRSSRWQSTTADNHSAGCSAGLTSRIHDELTTIELPFDIVRRDNGARVLATGASMPAIDSSASALVKAVARGYAWCYSACNFDPL